MPGEDRYAELRQDIKDLQDVVRESFAELRKELRTDYVSRAEYDVTVTSLTKAIEDIRRANRWGLDKLIGIATPSVLAAAAFLAGILTK